MAKKIFCEWSTVEDLVVDLSKKIPKDIKFIYGLKRGGLIPAVMLSHMTGITMINDCSSYNAWQILIVDDICDSGKTLSEMLAPNPTAVLHYKPHTANITPNFYASKFGSNDWIVYPWEVKESKPIQDYKI